MAVASTTTKQHPGVKDLTIETLRGLACVLLVLHHTVGSDVGAGLNVQDGTVLRWVTDSVLFLRMPLFTFLSGFVYAIRPAYSDWGGFMAKKGRRLLVPMFFLGTIYVWVKLHVPDVNNSFSLPFWQWHIVVPIEHFWFLEALILLFALIAVIDRFRLAETRTTALAWVVGAIAFSAVVGPLIREITFFSIPGAVYLLPFFFLGIFARRLDWRGSPAALQIGVGILAAALVVVSQLGLAGILPDLQVRYNVFGILFSAAACLALLSTRWVWRPLAFVGTFSYAIFLLHVFATAGSRILLIRLGVDNTYLLLIAGMAAALTLPMLVQWACGYSRVLRLLVLGQAWRAPTKPRRLAIRRTPSSPS